jgi:tetratricopeptide (TPR) repeat protein
LPKEKVLARVRAEQTISEPVRQEALALVQRFRPEQDPQRYDRASRHLARQPWLAVRWYREALCQAEVACRLAPQNASYRTTLGMAQYRLGQYGEACATLTQADQVGPGSPRTLAFLAMAQHQLGHAEQARATLGRLREVMSKAEWAKDDEAEGFLREAEELVPGR